MKKYTILVVEDEIPLLNAVTKKLERSGFGVYGVRSVQEAKESLLKHKVDAIWLDHYLVGRQSGLDLVTELKDEKSRFKKLPIFVVSNTATPDKVKSYIELKVTHYYTKSDVKLEKVIDEIKKSLERI